MTTQHHPPQHSAAADHPFAHLEAPYEWFDQIRHPPFYSKAFGGWLITRYADICWIVDRPDLFSAQDTMTPPQLPPASVQAILAEGYPPVPAVQNSDGELHRRLRSLVEHVFVPQFKSMRPFLREEAQALINEWKPTGQADLMADFALPLSFATLCRLLAIPAEERIQFRQWSDETLDLVAGMVSPVPMPEERQMTCARAFVALQHYLGRLIEQRGTHPGADVISGLARASLPGVDPLAEEELIAVLIDVLLGGYKTTASLIGSSVALLLAFPAVWQELRQHPEQIALALEEVLRYDAPVQAMVRTTTREVALPDTPEPVPPGAKVLLLYGAANRDPAQFPQAHRSDFHRKPNRHLAFGHGIHTCVGAPLARLEGQVALETLTHVFPHLQLAPGTRLRHIPTLMYRGLRRLDVVWPDPALEAVPAPQ